MNVYLLAVLCGLGYIAIAGPLAILIGRHLRWVRRTRTRPVEFMFPPGPDGGHHLRRKP